MIKSQICSTEAGIRRILDEHLAELVGEKQEVRIHRKEVGDDFTGFVESYIPKGSPEHDEEDCDALYIEIKDGMGYVFRMSEIATLEVLSTRRMTPSLALRQMKEMECATGVKHD